MQIQRLSLSSPCIRRAHQGRELQNTLAQHFTYAEIEEEEGGGERSGNAVEFETLFNI